MLIEIIIYTTSMCLYCLEAKKFLKAKGAIYREIDVSDDPYKRQEMMLKSGGKRTVPQIFIAGESIGGYSDLKELDRQGNLDHKLFGAQKA